MDHLRKRGVRPESRGGASLERSYGLAILDDVAATHREVVITKRGRPVARLLPVVSEREREEEVLALLRGRAKMLVSEREFLRPLTGEAGWQLGDDE